MHAGMEKLGKKESIIACFKIPVHLPDNDQRIHKKSPLTCC